MDRTRTLRNLSQQLSAVSLTGKKIPVYGDGKQIRDWLYVADHCEALRRILDYGVAGQSYNIGGDCEMTNLDLISSIYDELISTQPELVSAPMDSFISHVADRLGHDRRYSIDANKMKRNLVGNPPINLKMA